MPIKALIAVLTLICAATSAGADDTPLLDVVATTNLSTTPEHVARYLEELNTAVTFPLGALDPVTYSGDDKPTDGAAKYRLSIDHRGTITLGSLQQVANGHPVLAQEFVGNTLKTTIDKAQWRTVWGMKVTHKGTLAFKLSEWDGKQYKTLSAWTSAVKDANLAAAEGTVIIATVEQDATQNFDRTPRCPVTPEEAKAKAYDELLPGDVGKAIGAGLVQVKVLRMVKKKAPDGLPGLLGGKAAELELSVKNGSPWAVESMTVVVAGSEKEGHSLFLEHTFEKPLAAGKTATVRGEAGLVLAAGKQEPVAVPAIKFVAAEKQER